ncbi:hypothetical protein [Bacillus cereus]|uniref:hypothetical protein n=1 Tax=Bacillus cereus TaxID=1396 RepID=UPI00141979BE|nr:hypothetical protein [Bacillus cereus]
MQNNYKGNTYTTNNCKVCIYKRYPTLEHYHLCTNKGYCPTIFESELVYELPFNIPCNHCGTGYVLGEYPGDPPLEYYQAVAYYNNPKNEKIVQDVVMRLRAGQDVPLPHDGGYIDRTYREAPDQNFNDNFKKWAILFFSDSVNGPFKAVLFYIDVILLDPDLRHVVQIVGYRPGDTRRVGFLNTDIWAVQ